MCSIYCGYEHSIFWYLLCLGYSYSTIKESQSLGVKLAAEQYFGSRFLVYAKYENLSLDIDGSESAQGIYNSAEDLTLIQLGGTVFF